MKFTDGFWVTKPGHQLFNCAQVQDARMVDGHYAVYCSIVPITHRGMTLQGPMITLTFRAPREGIIAVKAEHYQGVCRKQPKFELAEDGEALAVSEDEDAITLKSGALSAIITKSPFALSFFERGVRLTGLKDRHMGYALTPDGAHMRAKLDVSVGEKIYGLGERFTPFVKNGQVVDIWNEDGGTASELSYKNIPFYITNRGYGVLVNSTGKVSYELCSEAVQSAQFSVTGESMEFMVVGGGDMAGVIRNYTALTGRPQLPPAWSFGLWLTTSFTTDYNEATILAFVDGMAARGIPLHVFHFDCFWMQGFEWCNFLWDTKMFPDPEGLLKKLKARGLKVCVWINPYIGQKSRLFREAMDLGYLLKRDNGDVWQWDRWQPGMGVVDFTNPQAWTWYQNKLKALMDMGVDCFKTDFGERIPTDCVYHDGSDPVLMHNYYTELYNRCVFELLEQELGAGEACVFARSATVGGQKYPVHWGGDSSSNFPSMAESLRAGLSLTLSGFGFWSHDISGFEDTATPEVYQRWAQFGLLSSHSRLHGSSSYRVPWLFGADSPKVVKAFTELKCRLMPYLYAAAVNAHETGVPVMRAMPLAFPGDLGAEDCDRQYMLGEHILVAPVFRDDGVADYYLPEGTWTHLLSGEVARGGGWRRGAYDNMSLPLFARANGIVALGQSESQVDYDYLNGLEIRVYQVCGMAEAVVVDSKGKKQLTVRAQPEGGRVKVSVDGPHKGIAVKCYQGFEVREGTIAPGATELTI